MLMKLLREGLRLTLLFLILATAVALVARGQESPPTPQVPGGAKASQDQQTAAPQGDVSEGKTELSSKQVASLPLNKRDFTKFLTLAGGTTTDTNGANNSTLQFAVKRRINIHHRKLQSRTCQYGNRPPTLRLVKFICFLKALNLPQLG